MEIAIAPLAHAEDFNIPRGDLKAALDRYTTQTGTPLLYVSNAVQGVQTAGVKGNVGADEALSKILSGTGFVIHRDSSGVIAVIRSSSSRNDDAVGAIELAQATPARSAVETVTVTSSKLGGADVQSIPISITALSQEQLTATQTAGGPDLVKQVPNMTFTKTNFSGYSIQLRGIGTQAISVTTDPAVAVAFNDIPFIRNHFFEQEFYDVSQVEVLRGPQGTLYGRNATAGVVNLVSAKPTDQFEAMASLDVGNYGNRRPEGMINIPIVDDRLDIRIAGEWTKRQGYSFNEITDARIDGRDLWSGRVSLAIKPVENLQMTLVWEHFSEDDDRMRSAKQLCKTAPVPTEIGGIPVPPGEDFGGVTQFGSLSQGCQMTSLYAPSAFEEPNINSLPYISVLAMVARSTHIPPYPSDMQSQNLRVIDATINPIYRAKNDTVELNSDYAVSQVLTLTSQTAFNHDFLWSTEDYNRYNSQPGVFRQFASNDDLVIGPVIKVTVPGSNIEDVAGTFCDPQLGCSNRIVAQDLSDEHAWQLNQEFRLASNFSGPFNFSAGGNYLHYETEENYYVFINALTLYQADQALFGNGFGSNPLYGQPVSTSTGDHTGWAPGPQIWTPGVSDNSQCLINGTGYFHPSKNSSDVFGCGYIDPNPLTNLNNEGHNYFLSQNPYTLNSYAAFGEVSYNILNDFKLTSGLRWTEDRKHFIDIPSELLIPGYGYPISGVVNQQWDQLTGRAVANWTPKLSFTDQTLVYGSYAHGYKAGGANPPGATLLTFAGGDISNPIHPLTFKPEFIDAFELGTKNTLLDGALTLNGDIFYYNYENYQISEIVDRSAINLNFDAHVKGAEVEGAWEPVPGLRFNFAGGWEDTALAKGSQSVDLMDRTAGNSNWIVLETVSHPSIKLYFAGICHSRAA